MQLETENRRAQPRHQCVAKATLTAGDSVHHGIVENVSAGGALVSICVESSNHPGGETSEPIAKGRSVRVTIPAVGISSVVAVIVRDLEDEASYGSMSGSWGRSIGIRFNRAQSSVPLRLIDRAVRRRAQSK